MKKTYLVLLIAVIFVLAMFPMGALADSVYTDWTSDNSLPTASGSYKLTQDVTVSSTYTVGAWSGNTTSVVLDLNGHTVKFANSSAQYYVQNAGSLTITDSVGTGKMTNAGSSGTTGYMIHVKGFLQIDGGTIENAISSGCAVYVNGETKQAVCIMNDGTIINSYTKSGDAVKVNNKATFIMNNGTVQNNATGTAGTCEAIEGGSSSSKIEINGGKIISNGTGIKSSGAPVTVTGGTIEAGWYAFETRYATVENATVTAGTAADAASVGAIFKPYSAPAEGDGNKVLSGTFDAPKLSHGNNKANVEVEGGAFDDMADVEEYLAPGATVAEDGKVTPCQHATTEEVAGTAVPATCKEPGRTADLTCTICGELAAEGTETPLADHEYENGICIYCSAEQPADQPADQPDETIPDNGTTTPDEDKKPENNIPKTGDKENILAMVIAIIASAGCVFFACRKLSRSR